MRVIITGSRDWGDKFAVVNEIAKLHIEYSDDLVIVHGDNRDPACPDAIAHSYALTRGIKVERWPVMRDEWKAYGRAAGPHRNRRMVRAGANLCLAFIAPCTDSRCKDKPAHGSHGASGCAQFAIAAGIQTEIKREAS